MTKHNDGGPAFPLQPASMPEMHYLGMTLRDWFAGQALSSLVRSDDYNPDGYAETAYEYADVMLAARDEGGSDEV